MVLVGHFREIVTQGFAILNTNRFRHSRSKQLESVAYRRVHGEACRNTNAVVERIATIVFKDLGEAVKKREWKRSLVSIVKSLVWQSCFSSPGLRDIPSAGGLVGVSTLEPLALSGLVPIRVIVDRLATTGDNLAENAGLLVSICLPAGF